MGEISKLPNIGKKVEEQLEQAGVSTLAELIDLGSRKTFERLITIDDTSCINKLYTLEGAIQGICWHHLPDKDKKILKEHYNSLK